MNEQIGNKINDKTYIKLTPFKGFVLENFPFIEADFDAITNYQLLCKVIEYLNNVISNQNTVQELGTDLVNAYNSLVDAVNLAINEFETDITGDFNDLKNYVDNYFDNNFPQLISDKLDEMAEDGTLENLLNDAAHLIKVYNTYADMIADSSTFTNGLRLKTLGYYSINDGGGAEYYVNNSVIATNYQISLENELYLNLILKNNTLNIKQLGAYGDGTHDDYSCFNTALSLNNKVILIPDGTYLISEQLIVTSNNITLKGQNNSKLLGTDDLFEGQLNAACVNFRNSTNLTIKNLIFNNGTTWIQRPTYGEQGYEEYLQKRSQTLHAMSLYNVSKFYIDNCTFEYGCLGFHCNGSNTGNITNCLSQKNLGDGFFIEGNSYDIKVTNCKTYNVDDDSFSADGYSDYNGSPKRILFNNCIAQDSFGALCALVGSSYTKISNSIGYNLQYVPVKLGILKNGQGVYVGTSASHQTVENCTVYLSGNVRSDGSSIGYDRFASKMIDSSSDYHSNNITISNCNFVNNGDNNLYMIYEYCDGLKFINNTISGKLGMKFNNLTDVIFTGNNLDLLAPVLFETCNRVVGNNNKIRNSQDINWGINNKNLWFKWCNNVEAIGNDIEHKISFEILTSTDSYSGFKTDETNDLGFKQYQTGIQVLGIYVSSNFMAYSNYVPGQLTYSPTSGYLRLATSSSFVVLYNPST